MTAKTVAEWVKQGMPKLSRGRFDLTKVEQWRKDVLGQRDEGKKDTKAYWQMQKWKLDCRKSEIAIAELEGSLHSRDECSRSLTALRAKESRILHTLPDRLASRFPELGAKLKQAAAEEVDEILERLNHE